MVFNFLLQLTTMPYLAYIYDQNLFNSVSTLLVWKLCEQLQSQRLPPIRFSVTHVAVPASPWVPPGGSGSRLIYTATTITSHGGGYVRF